MKLLPRVLLACLATLGATGCATFGGGDDGQVEIDRLRREAVAARRRATVAEVENRRLMQEIERLEQEIEALSRPARLEEPDRPTIETRPGIESSDIAEEPLTPPRPADVPPITTPPPPSSAPPPAQPQASASERDDLAAGGGATAVDAAGQAIYDDGYTLFHRQQYDQAETRFREFLAGWGRSDLADNAQFWVGECRYARDDFRGALDAFLGVVEQYPDGNKVPDAMLKAGKSLEALGDPAAAAETYDEIVANFPGSAAAAIARELRASLR